MNRLVTVFRGDRPESFHTGSIAVVESSGRLLACLGDPGELICLRSAAKPFQAIPMLVEGLVEEYDLAPEEIALISASHGGEPKHVAVAAALLRRGDFDETDLLCGAHPPLDERAAADLRATGETASVLHNNCSGKHAGMLLASRLMDASTSDYNAADHPLQLNIRQTLAEFAGLAAVEIPLAIDGCGVPAFFLSVYRTALAYARLAATAQPDGHPASLPRYADPTRELVDAITACPDYLAGNWSITTPLISAFDRQLIAKEGAEGVYAMAIQPPLTASLPERFALEPGAAVGICLKIHDGSMGRGRDPAILRILSELQLEPASPALLEPHRRTTLKNVPGMEVGEIRSDFRLLPM